MWERRRQRRLASYTLPLGVVVGGGPPPCSGATDRERQSATSLSLSSRPICWWLPIHFFSGVCADPPRPPHRAGGPPVHGDGVRKMSQSPTKRREMDVMKLCASVRPPPVPCHPHSTRRTMGHFPGDNKLDHARRVIIHPTSRTDRGRAALSGLLVMPRPVHSLNRRLPFCAPQNDERLRCDPRE